MKNKVWSLAGIFLLTASILACSLVKPLNSTPPAAATLGQLYTAAALTLDASSSVVADLTPSATTTLTFPTLPTGIASNTPASVPLCNAAAFVRDVSFPDGTTIDPEQEFTKTWRLQNVGTCSWTPAYSLVFINGDRMQAPVSISLVGNVNPGQMVDLSVGMTAPNLEGQYQGFWKLRNTTGTLFGIGAGAQGAFWIKIHVEGPSYTAYDFAAQYCDASWRNNNTDLPCPGSDGDSRGYVIKINKPVLESGSHEDEAGLLTVPKDAYNGLITGKYPAFKIRKGDRFQALVNCKYKAYTCNVLFGLDYQIEGEATRTLGHWNEAYEGKFYLASIDLSPLAGEYVKFILRVSTNGPWEQDLVMWIAPSITRRGSPPPTSTPTATSTNTATATMTASPTLAPTP